MKLEGLLQNQFRDQTGNSRDRWIDGQTEQTLDMRKSVDSGTWGNLE